MTLSRLISIITHPILMPFFGFYISIKMMPNPLIENLTFIYSVFFISSVLIPCLATILLLKYGEIKSLNMNNANERIIPLIITACCLCLGYSILYPIIDSFPLLKSQILGIIIIMVITSIISKFWKISLHMIGVGGVIGVLSAIQFLYHNTLHLIVIAVIVAFIIGLARIKEKSHTLSQIYLGLFLAILLETIIIIIY